MRLQGMNPMAFNIAVSDAQLSQQIGNSMSLNVLERIFCRLLPAAGLSGKIKDRWASGEALDALKNSRGKSFASVFSRAQRLSLALREVADNTQLYTPQSKRNCSKTKEPTPGKRKRVV